MTHARRRARAALACISHRIWAVPALLLATLAPPLSPAAHATAPAASRPHGAAASAKPAPRALPIHRFTLSNGLRVVVQPDHRAPVVALGIMVDVGGRDEQPGRSGLAHFFEHMMFQGSKHVAKMAHFTELESVGADLNANTSVDRTYYYEIMPKNALELALWLESDRFAHLKISAKNVENQRQTVMEERRQRYDNRPYAASQLKLMQMLFTTWPLQHSVIGSMADLKRAPLAAFEQFWRRWYTPNNCVLVMVGDVSVETARTLLSRTMGRVERRAEVSHPAVSDTPRKGHTYGTYAEPLGKMPAFHLAYRVPAYDQPGSAAVELLAEVLNGGEASRLSRRLEKETGLATRFWAGKYGRRDADGFQIAVEVSQAKASAVAKAKQIVRDALYDIAVRGVTKAELRRAKIGLETRFVFRQLSLSARASMLARMETYYGDATKVNQALGRWRAVTAADIQAAALRWFRWDHEVELDVLPKGYAAPKSAGRMPRNVATWERKLARAKAKRARRAARAAARKARAAARAARAAEAKRAKAEARKLGAARRAAAKAQHAADIARQKAAEPSYAPPPGLPTAATASGANPPQAPAAEGEEPGATSPRAATSKVGGDQ